MKPCKFRFDYPETIYHGFAHGSRWNGFDNVAVTKETLDKIRADVAADGVEDPRQAIRSPTSSRWLTAFTRWDGASLRKSCHKS